MLWKLDAAAEHAVNTPLGIDRIEGALLDGAQSNKSLDASGGSVFLN